MTKQQQPKKLHFPLMSTKLTNKQEVTSIFSHFSGVCYEVKGQLVW